MAFIKEKIAEKKIPKKVVPKIQAESSFNKRLREGREQDKKEIEDKKQKELDHIVEENRMDKLIIPYLDNLQEQLVEKNLLHFWTFPDEPGFIKYKGISGVDDMQKFIDKDIEKYTKRNAVSVSVLFYHHDSKVTNMFRKIGVYFKVSMSVFPITSKGELVTNGYDNWGCDFTWKMDDFKLSKFSFKLLETILIPVGTGKRSYSGFLGVSLRYIIDDLQKIKMNFGKILVPLPGSIKK